MSARKRPRNNDDVDGDVETEVESASSNLRLSGHKRSRLSLARHSDGYTDSHERDSEEMLEIDSRRRTSHLEEQNRSDNHSSDGDEEEDDVNNIQATQYVTKDYKDKRTNTAAEYGVVEEVYCGNFMCHSRLRIKLSPLINFIIGHNGSGKSAVLTALTMCLGGKATATNRGGNLKSLIKEGEETATLAVKIKNIGEGAYRPDLYGESITVERHFSRSGVSGFRLKSKQGRVISTKRSELDDILDYFGLQIDNPINVLTQDLARQFLSSSTPGDKYKFFIRGTQLETLDMDYKLLEENYDKTQQKLELRAADVQELASKMQAAHERKRLAARTQVIEERINNTVQMHAWAQVEIEEKNLQERDAEIESFQLRIQEAEQTAESKSNIFEGHHQSLEAAKRVMTEFASQHEPKKEEFDSRKEAFDQIKKEISNKLADERSIKDQLTASKNRMNDLKRQMEEENARLADADGSEHHGRMTRLEQLKGDAEQAQQELRDHDRGLQQLQQAETDASPAVETAKTARGNAQQELQKAQGQLKRLADDQGRQYAAFRPRTEELVRAIRNETRWRQKPVGPMGLHVRLLKSEWSSILEKTFGGALDSFVVTCKEDQSLLSDMMRRVNCHAPVIIGNANARDTSAFEPDKAVDTILRILEIDNQLVKNQLLINQHIEQMVLIPKREDAYEFHSRRPRNVKTVTCFGNERGYGFRFERTARGAEKSGPVQKWEGAARMKTDREEQMRMARENLDHAQRVLHTADENVKEKSQAMQEVKQALVAHGRHRRQLNEAVQRADDAVDELQAEIEGQRPQDGRLEALQGQLEETQADHRLSENQYMSLFNEKEALGKSNREMLEHLNKAKEQLQQHELNLEKQRVRIEKVRAVRDDALRDKNHALEAIDRAREQLVVAEQRKSEQKATVDEFTAQASSICARVPVEPGITSTALDERLKSLHTELGRANRAAGGSREELTEAYRQAKQAYVDATKQIKEFEALQKALMHTLNERKHRWVQFRKGITKRARIMFMYLLSERNFRGRLIVDHQNKLLDLRVEPDMAKASDAGRQAKTLSGGEKSFSTICLLLSIWEALGSPIRCLDEFDVFMDNVNRSQTMGLMIGAARRAVGKQFILITPQSMASVEMGDDIRIHKMSDPERGQTALPFSTAR